MSEPTKEAIEEARKLGYKFGLDVRTWYEFTPKELARIIADVRTQATNDTLEIVANVAAQYPIAAFPENSSSVDASSARMARLVCKVIAEEIRAMKVPT